MMPELDQLAAGAIEQREPVQLVKLGHYRAAT